ncbi:MAG TPA: sugar transferase [Candidatus Gastranaerophilales bacterium]|nr:sugar transferase [Candidatus Gastranaerophilales bacterium]
MNAVLEKKVYDISSIKFSNFNEIIEKENLKTNLNLDVDNNKNFKRLFDIIFSMLVLILLSPLFLIFGALVKFCSPKGNIFFKHERIGKHGKPFKCYKFRTMHVNADKMLETMLKNNCKLREEFKKDFKLKNDPRIIPVIGKILRKTSLDELPQFYNVLKGEMSVVGPRPIVNQECCMYGRKLSRFLSVKPGITGLWQVSGRNDICYKTRIALDLCYIKNGNFLKDLQIIFKTISVIFSKKGAY